MRMTVMNVRMLEVVLKKLKKEGVINNNTPIVVTDDDEINGVHGCWGYGIFEGKDIEYNNIEWVLEGTDEKKVLLLG